MSRSAATNCPLPQFFPLPNTPHTIFSTLRTNLYLQYVLAKSIISFVCIISCLFRNTALKGRDATSSSPSSPTPSSHLPPIIATSVLNQPPTVSSVEPYLEPVSVCGRRIVNISDFFFQMKNLGNHGPLGCTVNNMVLMREKRVGLKCCFLFQCNFCRVEQSVWSEEDNKNEMDVNCSAVIGTMTTGGGHSQLEEILSTMNIPPMSDKTYRKYEERISEGLMGTAVEEMKKAAEEEARHAVELGEVDKDGTPLITVVADGSWCKRSYRTNYSSLSGVVSRFPLLVNYVVIYFKLYTL